MVKTAIQQISYKLFLVVADTFPNELFLYIVFPRQQRYSRRSPQGSNSNLWCGVVPFLPFRVLASANLNITGTEKINILLPFFKTCPAPQNCFQQKNNIGVLCSAWLNDAPPPFRHVLSAALEVSLVQLLEGKLESAKKKIMRCCLWEKSVLSYAIKSLVTSTGSNFS